MAVRLCSSPMSASTELNAGSAAGSSAGTARPARAMQTARPSAFMTAVLPPVLGPVMTTAEVWGRMLRSMGTGGRRAWYARCVVQCEVLGTAMAHHSGKE